MKNLLFILFLILSTSIVHSQEQENQFTNSIGMDVIPSFAVLFDGDINYLEFGYVKSLNSIDLRAKINFNKMSALNGKAFQKFDIDPDENTVFNSIYQSRRNLLISLGVAKRFRQGKLIYYFGMDTDLGLNHGDATSFIYDEVSSETIKGFGFVKSNHHSLGVTPILGAYVPLMPRVRLAVEIGVPLVFTFGDIGYINNNGELKTYDVTSRSANFNRLLNDLRICFSF